MILKILLGSTGEYCEAAMPHPTLPDGPGFDVVVRIVVWVFVRGVVATKSSPQQMLFEHKNPAAHKPL